MRPDADDIKMLVLAQCWAIASDRRPSHPPAPKCLQGHGWWIITIPVCGCNPSSVGQAHGLSTILSQSAISHTCPPPPPQPHHVANLPLSQRDRTTDGATVFNVLHLYCAFHPAHRLSRSWPLLNLLTVIPLSIFLERNG